MDQLTSLPSCLQGNQIVAMVRNTQKANCFPLISEGKVYQISNAKVVTAAKAFRAVDRNVSLLIFHGTRIQPAADTDLIPRHRFDLTPFEEVARLINTTTNLIGNKNCNKHMSSFMLIPR